MFVFLRKFNNLKNYHNFLGAQCAYLKNSHNFLGAQCAYYVEYGITQKLGRCSWGDFNLFGVTKISKI